MRDRIASFLALSPPDQRLVIETVIVQPFVPVGLRLLGFRRCRRVLLWLTPIAGSSLARAAASESARRAARLVEACGRTCSVGATCLSRSLTLWWLLRRRGIPVHLCIGVRKPAGALEAHAWVEHGDEVLNDDSRVRTRFAAFGPRGVDLALRGASSR